MISSIQRQQQLVRLRQADQNKPQNSEGSSQRLMGKFQNMLESVNTEQVVADQKIADMVAGKNKDIAGTMIAMEKAEVSMKMLMSVRNKAVAAYEEVMRMQI